MQLGECQRTADVVRTTGEGQRTMAVVSTTIVSLSASRECRSGGMTSRLPLRPSQLVLPVLSGHDDRRLAWAVVLRQ